MSKNAVNSGEAKVSSARKNIIFTKEKAIELYLVRNMPMSDIGKIYGVTGSAINYWIRKYGIQKRSKVQKVLFMPTPTLSYVFGVLHGDGFVLVSPHNNSRYVSLRVIDKAFAESFAVALRCLGLRATVKSYSKTTAGNPVWQVWCRSKSFATKWNQLTPAERLDMGMLYPYDFLRGLYESEGTVKWHKTSLEMSIGTTNKPLMERVHKELIRMGFKSRFVTVPGATDVYNDFYRTDIYNNLDIAKFMAFVKPCIKYEPRNIHHANPEPSLDSDAQEGVESTKGDCNV